MADEKIIRKSKQEKLFIIKEVYKLLCQFNSYAQIIDYLKQKHNIKSKNAKRYYTAAQKLLRKDFTKDIEDLRTMANNRYNNLIIQAQSIDNVKDRLNIIKDIAKQQDKINGLESQKIEHTGKIDITDITDINDKIDKLLELRSKDVKSE